MKMIRAIILAISIFSLAISFAGCKSGGKSLEERLVGSWYEDGETTMTRDGVQGPNFTLYDDMTCEIATEYGTGAWAVVNDKELKLTNYYGESEVAVITEIKDEKLVLSFNGNTRVFYSNIEDKNPNDNLEKTDVYSDKDKIEIIDGDEFSENVAWIKYQIISNEQSSAPQFGLIKLSGEIIPIALPDEVEYWGSQFCEGYSYINYRIGDQSHCLIINDEGTITMKSGNDAGYEIMCGGGNWYLVKKMIRTIDKSEDIYGIVDAQGNWVYEPTTDFLFGYNQGIDWRLEKGAKYYYLGNGFFQAQWFPGDAGRNIPLNTILDAKQANYNLIELPLETLYESRVQGLCDNKVIWSYSNAYESKVYRLNNDGSSKEIASVNGWLDIKCSENIIYVATDKGENACFLTCDGAIVADYSKYTLETSEKYSKYIGDYAAVVIRGADNNLYLQIIDGQGNCQFEPIKLNSTINISEGKVACILPENTSKVVWIDYQGKVSDCPANITGKLSFNNGYAFDRSVKNYISRDGTCMELSIIKINLENQQKGTAHTIPEDSSEATHADARNSTVSAITHAPENEIVISQTTGNEMPENSGGADYIIPDSDSRYLTWDDVSGLSLREINYAKNEIYARHGRMFNSKELMEYFSTKSWYSPKYDADIFDEIYAPQLNEYEIDNAFFLRSVEFEISPEGYMLDQQS